jgi:hypothetical protein
MTFDQVRIEDLDQVGTNNAMTHVLVLTAEVRRGMSGYGRL